MAAERAEEPDLAPRGPRGAIVEAAPRPEECARSPGADFTRSRKLPLLKTLWTMVTWDGDTIGVELESGGGWGDATPSASAF